METRLTTNQHEQIIEMTDLNESSPGISEKLNQSDVADGGRRTNIPSNNYHTKKSMAEGMMDLSLLTANANQLKFLLFYNQKSSTFWPTISLIILSLVLQVVIGFTLIFRVCMMF